MDFLIFFSGVLVGLGVMLWISNRRLNNLKDQFASYLKDLDSKK